ncbi:MAG TPA: hypothetical protein VIP51_10090 [Eoetvoesiella sp.]
MEQDRKSGKPSQRDPEQGNKIDPRLREPYGPEGYRSGIDDRGPATKKNPGHPNPAHNTPGHIRQNQPGQQGPGQPGQSQTQSYPGTQGPKARDLQQDSDTAGEQVKGKVEKNANAAQRTAGNADDVQDIPKE